MATQPAERKYAEWISSARCLSIARLRDLGREGEARTRGCGSNRVTAAGSPPPLGMRKMGLPEVPEKSIVPSRFQEPPQTQRSGRQCLYRSSVNVHALEACVADVAEPEIL